MLKTLGQIAYEADALTTGCREPWEDANQEKWESVAAAVYAALASELPTAWREAGRVCSECGEYVPLGWMHGCA